MSKAYLRNWTTYLIFNLSLQNGLFFDDFDFGFVTCFGEWSYHLRAVGILFVIAFPRT